MFSYLPAAIISPLVRGGDLLRGALGSISWGPALSASKTAVTSLLTKIEVGQLIIFDETTAEILMYGQKIAKEHSKPSGGNPGVNGVNRPKKTGSVRRVELVVKKESFWVRLFLFADMGFAEAYMLGDFECADLTGFFEVCMY